MCRNRVVVENKDDDDRKADDRVTRLKFTISARRNDIVYTELQRRWMLLLLYIVKRMGFKTNVYVRVFVFVYGLSL